MKDATNFAYGCIFSNPYTTFSGAQHTTALVSTGHTFWVAAAKNLSEIGIRISSKTGTINYGEIEVTVYPVNQTTGYPDLTTVLGSTTATSNGSYVFTGTNYNRFIFSSPIALGANTLYCFLFRNLNATPASNYFTIEYTAITRLFDASSTTSLLVEASLRSTNNTSWTRGSYGGDWFVTFDDNTSIGLPITNAMNSSNASNMPLLFKTPNSRIVMNGFRALGFRSGTYTNTTILRLKRDNDTIADSINYYNFGQYSTGSSPVAFFFDDIILEANTIYTIQLVYTSGTAAGVNMFSFGNIFNCIDYLNLRSQFTGESTEGYLNGDKSNPTRVTPFTIFGEIENPIYPRSIITPS